MKRTLWRADGRIRGDGIVRSVMQLPGWQKALIIVGAIVALQQFIPAGWISPRSQLDSKPVGWATASGVSKNLLERQEAMELAIGHNEVEVNPEQSGVSVDTHATVRQLPALGYWWRLVPLGPAVHALRITSVQTVVHVDDQKLQAYANELAKQYTYPSVNARAEIQNGRLAIVPAGPGQRVEAEAIVAALKRLPYESSLKAPIATQQMIATTSEEHLNDVRKTYDSLQSAKLTVTFGDLTKTYDAAAFNTWLQAVQDPSTKAWRLEFKAENLAGQLEEWQKQYSEPSGVTQVMVVDGVETSREVGPSGRKLNAAEVERQLREWVQNPSAQPVELTAEVIAPRVAYTRTYTKSSSALQAKIDDWVAGHKGTYQIAVQELGGQGRTASHNVSERTVMASTYKLFVAYVAYHQAELDLLDLSMKLSNGKTVEQCIEVSIVNSDNECADLLGKHIGWAKMDEIVQAAGFENVSLNNYDAEGQFSGDKLVNASELAKFLAQLSSGALMNEAHTTTLLSYMKRQVYRQGIPAGSHGAVVADKVGFLESYLHDAAIVYGPKSTYALVIMSSDSSWSNISSLADAIYTFMSE